MGADTNRNANATHRHPLFARFYAWMSPKMEEGGAAEHRDELLGGLRGRAIEVGCGNGLNFSHYPEGVESVLAVEPEPYLREIAERAAADARVPIRVVEGLAEKLPAEDDSFERRWPPSSSARSATRAGHSRSCGGCCDPAASCASTSMSPTTAR